MLKPIYFNEICFHLIDVHLHDIFTQFHTICNKSDGRFREQFLKGGELIE